MSVPATSTPPEPAGSPEADALPAPAGPAEPGGPAEPSGSTGPAPPPVPTGSRGLQILAVVLGGLTVFYGLLVLSLRPAAVASIAVLAAIALFSAGIGHFVLARSVPGGWRWLAYVAGAVVILAGFLALVQPAITLLFLAVLLAWSFVFHGLVRIVTSLVSRGEMWWFGLIIGILELLVGVWAVASPGREVLLLINLVGIFLIFAGVDSIVAAFSRPAPAEVAR